MTNNTDERFTAAIAGGSMVGLALARALAQWMPADGRILVIDSGPANRQGGGVTWNVGTADRAEALGVDLREISIYLDRLLWVRQGDGDQPYPSEHRGLRWKEAPGHQPQWGTTWHLTQRAMAADLPTCIAMRRGWVKRAQTANGGHPSLVLSDDSLLSASVVFDATGASSRIRREFDRQDQGCDGPVSALRHEPERLGVVAIRGLTPIEAVANQPDGDLAFVSDDGKSGLLTSYLGHMLRFIVYPVPAITESGDRTVVLNWNMYLKLPDYQLLFKNNSGLLASDARDNFLKVALPDLVELMELPEPFRSIVLATPDPYARDVVGGYVRDLVTRVGDAGTPFPPWRGQGGNNGFDGAIDLANAIGPLLLLPGPEQTSALAAMLGKWEQHHAPRTRERLDELFRLPYMQPLDGGNEMALDPFRHVDPYAAKATALDLTGALIPAM